METVNKLRGILRLRAPDGIKLHVEENRQRGKHIKIADNEYKIFGLDTRKNKTIRELKSAEFSDLGDMAF